MVGATADPAQAYATCPAAQHSVLVPVQRGDQAVPFLRHPGRHPERPGNGVCRGAEAQAVDTHDRVHPVVRSLLPPQAGGQGLERGVQDEVEVVGRRDSPGSPVVRAGQCRLGENAVAELP